MTKAAFTVGHSSPSSAVTPPPPVDPGSDSDSDQDSYSLHELVIHAVDDDHGARLPAAPVLNLNAPAAPPPQEGYIERLVREAARLDHLGTFLIVPQAALCGLNVELGIVMICSVNNPEMQTNFVTWVTACSAVVVISTLLSMLLSYLAVYHYDG